MLLPYGVDRLELLYSEHQTEGKEKDKEEESYEHEHESNIKLPN